MAVAMPACQSSSYFPGSRPRPALDYELEDIFPTGFPLKQDGVSAGPEYFFIDDSSSRASDYGGARRVSAKHERKPLKTQMDLQAHTLPGDTIARPAQKALSTGSWKKSLRDRRNVQDPDIEIMPSGFGTLANGQPVAPRRDYRQPPTAVVEEVKVLIAESSSLPEASGSSKGPEAGQEAVKQLHDKWEIAARKIAQAQQEAQRVEELLEQAAQYATLSDTFKAEADNALQHAQQAREHARELPTRVREALAAKRDELAAAKAAAEDAMRELNNARHLAGRAQHDRDSHAAEIQIIVKAAKTKRAELDELERALARLELVREEAIASQERSLHAVKEVKDLTRIAAERQSLVDSLSQGVERLRKRASQVAQEFSLVLSESEMADALVQRELKEAEALLVFAEARRLEALELANCWVKAKNAAEKAKEEEQKVWREARSFGDEVDELTKETLEKHLVEPAIKPDEALPPPRLQIEDKDEGRLPAMPVKVEVEGEVLLTPAEAELVTGRRGLAAGMPPTSAVAAMVAPEISVRGEILTEEGRRFTIEESPVREVQTPPRRAPARQDPSQARQATLFGEGAPPEQASSSSAPQVLHEQGQDSGQTTEHRSQQTSSQETHGHVQTQQTDPGQSEGHGARYGGQGTGAQYERQRERTQRETGQGCSEGVFAGGRSREGQHWGANAVSNACPRTAAVGAAEASQGSQ